MVATNSCIKADLLSNFKTCHEECWYGFTIGSVFSRPGSLNQKLMIAINSNHVFSSDNVLFTFALDSEAAEVFDGYNKLITGIGKVNAAYELTKAIQKSRPELIINLGSAGSAYFKKAEIICCTHFVQRDMDVRGLGYQKYETPLSGLPITLEYGLEMEGLQKGYAEQEIILKWGIQLQAIMLWIWKPIRWR
jgi:hypothetical protein